MTYSEIVRRMSRHFLTEELPEDWDNLSDDELDEFLVDHAWEPFQYWEADRIAEVIDAVASDVENMIKDETFLIKHLLKDQHD